MGDNIAFRLVPTMNEAKINVNDDYNNNIDILDRLLDILDHPVKRILPLLLSHRGNSHDDGSGKTTTGNSVVVADETKQCLQDLVTISKILFADIETLGKQYKDISQNGRNDTDTYTSTTNPNPLSSSLSASGVVELFVPPSVDPLDTDLPETMYGQIELQNEAVLKLVKKATHKLTKSTKDICVLDIRVTASSDDDHDDGDDDSDNNNEQEGNEGGRNDDENDDRGSDFDQDEETKRIHMRMARAMEDIMSEDEDERPVAGRQETTSSSESVQSNSQKDEELYDPVAESMKDGFFDLHEMEEFADEEEDYLPDEAFGQAESVINPRRKDKNETKKSFHQRQREGDLGSDSDNSDDDDDDDEVGGRLDEVYEEMKRKRYRDQEDINVLFSMYQKPNEEDDDVVDMTAADFFGAPKKQYLERYKKGRKTEPKEVGAQLDTGKRDDDSWGEYDFEMEDRSAWRDEIAAEHPNENVGDGESDEAAPTKDRLQEGGVAKIVRGMEAPGIRDEKLQRQTDELERELLAEKPWRMSGETRSNLRPVNSLLEGTPEFEMASKQAPTITVEHTVDLEEAIKKRILAEDWDDVVPRELPDVGWHKKRGELPAVSQEKSKLGLGELYEREYLKKAVGYDVDAAEKKTEEDKAKDEMKQLFANLCSRLDALSNYNFAPRPIADEAEVRPVTAPAIAMEEVLPLHVSDARAVAPEEVYATKRGRDGILRQETEMDQVDRKRLRQSKKAARRKARKAKLADDKLISRLEPGLGLNNPYEKRKAREELATARSRGNVTTGENDQDSRFGSSGTFFRRLQNEAQQAIQGAGGTSLQGPETKGREKSSAFKL